MVSLHQAGSQLLILLIRTYQLWLSPLLGPHCRFHPTCSAYGIEAIQQFGLAKGCWLLFKRILKCHPMHPGGNDPVPVKPNDNRDN